MKKPIVAILGRPNVGKSTLFNRVLKRRDAIVDDMPGVTRDRHYADAEWAGYQFKLLDTGGYVPASEDIFEQAIRDQVEYAIDEADLVVFVVDVTVGITGIDSEIARILQRANIPVVLVANKVDNNMREAELGEFYGLGLGDPIPVSALGGRNIGDCLDTVLDNLPKMQQEEEEDENILRLAVLGKPNVGKSSYVNALLGQNKMIVTDIAGTTRDAIDTEIKYKEMQISLVDTAGLRKRAKVKENIEFFSSVRTNNAVQRCDVAIILIDATQGITDQDKKVIALAIEYNKGIVIGVNKWDLVEKDTMTARRFEVEMQEAVRDINYLPIMFISAMTKQRVFKLLDVAISVNEERKKKIPTADLNKFLESAIKAHHPPAFGDKWVKINYVTQVHEQPPVFVYFTNEPRGIKDSYRNYLENRFREQFGFMGVPIQFKFRKKN